MKIIDLLNKIANGEEVPNKFKYDNLIFTKRWDNAYFDNDGDDLFNSLCTDFSNLNDEVEIIEEDKKIEEPKIDFMKEDDTLEDIVHMTTINVGKLTDKICEIIDYINNKD